MVKADHIDSTFTGTLELEGHDADAKREKVSAYLCRQITNVLETCNASLDVAVHAVAMVDLPGPALVFEL